MNRILKTILFFFVLLTASGFLIVMYLQFQREPAQTRIKRLLQTTHEILEDGDTSRLQDLEPVLAETFKNFPQDPELCLALMKTRIALGEIEGAIEAGKTGLKHNEDNSEIAYSLARAYTLNGDDEKAYMLLQSLQSKITTPRKVWREYIEVGRRLWKAKMNSGDRAFESGDLDKALDDYTRAATIAWDLRNMAEGLASARVHFTIGDIYRRKGDTEHAIQAYRSGLRFDPWRADKHLQLARMEEKAGMSNAALLHYRASLKINPQQKDAGEISRAIENLHAARSSREIASPKEHSGLIYILPLGNVDIELLQNAADSVMGILECRINFLDRQEFPLLTRLYFARKYDADRLYDIFFKHYRELIEKPDVLGIIAVCNKDLGLMSFRDYVYSWTARDFAVASYLRLDRTFYGLDRDRDELLKRMSIQLLMCCARVAGLDMCENVPCALTYPGSIENVALKEPALCKRCSRIFHILAETEERRDRTIEKMQRLLDDFPDDTAVLMQIGDLYLDTDRPEKAKIVYEKILRLNPTHFDAKNNLSKAEKDISAAKNEEPN